MPKRRNILTYNKTTKKKIKEIISKKNTTVIVNKEKHVDKDEGNKGAELADNPEPETQNPLKVGNISSFLKVKGIENYKVTSKEFQYVTDLAKITENLSPANFVPQMNIVVNKMKLEVKDKLKETKDMMKSIAPFLSDE